MTRTPRVTHDHDGAKDRIWRRVTSRKTLVTGGLGLALAGIGAAAVATGAAANAAPAAGAPAAKQAAPVERVVWVAAHAAEAVVRDASHPAAARHAETWSAVARIVAMRTFPRAGHGPLPAADRLTPLAASGPQTWLPMTAAQWHNATTIVRQALTRHMGLRSAVIAVATSMQESALVNVGYGTSDSLGLFQQRPSMGWGTAQQVMNPAHSAGAFLQALRTYQASDPAWAHQPLWVSAQGVQRSGYPYAYAKWEAQAAHVVKAVTSHMI